MSQVGSVSYVLGAYNEAQTLPITVPRVVERLAALPDSEVIVVENGSTDDTAEVAARLARDNSTAAVAVRAETSPKGLGNALRRGIDVARGERIMLTAADVPFGFSDLDAALALDPIPDVVIGSKAHPQSKVSVTLQRRVMSNGLRGLRRLMLGLDLGDTQGSVFIAQELAKSLLPDLQSTGYFLTTEVIALAAARGASIGEVPVDYSAPRADSKVEPVRDSLDVIREMSSLRKRIKHPQK